jgi:hypothetical protein
MLPIVEDTYFARKYLLVQNKNKIKSVQNNPVLRYPIRNILREIRLKLAKKSEKSVKVGTKRTNSPN